MQDALKHHKDIFVLTGEKDVNVAYDATVPGSKKKIGVYVYSPP